MVHAGENVGMWDEEDGFFYDVLRLPDGSAQRLKVRSMVGLLPLCAVTVFEGEGIWKDSEVVERLRRFLKSRPELSAYIHDPAKAGYGGRRLAAILSEDKLRRVLKVMLDERRILESLWNTRPLPLPCRASLCVSSGRPGVRRGVPAGGV